jgi:peroxiredoxin Q/BCP
MKKNDLVTDFSAIDQSGNEMRLSDLLRSGPVALFFYPKAMTPGWTKESCHFRDLASEFAELGAQRVGISADPVDRQKAFDEKNGLGFPLLSDPDREIARQFGIKRFGPLPSKRATFVIDTDRRLLGAITSELDMNTHADQALEVLRKRWTGSPTRRGSERGAPAPSRSIPGHDLGDHLRAERTAQDNTSQRFACRRMLRTHKRWGQERFVTNVERFDSALRERGFDRGP